MLFFSHPPFLSLLCLPKKVSVDATIPQRPYGLRSLFLFIFLSKQATPITFLFPSLYKMGSWELEIFFRIWWWEGNEEMGWLHKAYKLGNCQPHQGLSSKKLISSRQTRVTFPRIIADLFSNVPNALSNIREEYKLNNKSAFPKAKNNRVRNLLNCWRWGFAILVKKNASVKQLW